MALSRRSFLLIAGIGAAAAATEVGSLVTLPGVPAAAAAESTGVAGRGLFGGVTTLDHTVKQAQRIDTEKWSDYVKLRAGAGEAHLVRTDLGGNYARATRALETFVHITDMQIVDDKSPGRVEFTDRWADLGSTINKSTDSAYRPQESLSTHIVEAMARAIRDVAKGPMTGLPLSFTIATGDMVDNVQKNEVRWYIDLLDGGQEIRPESGKAGQRGERVGQLGPPCA